MRLWRYCYWEFLGPYLQTRRAEDGAVERVRELPEFERERERPLFWDQLSFYEELVTTDEYFMIGKIMLLCSLLWVHCTADQICSQNRNLIESHTRPIPLRREKCNVSKKDFSLLMEGDEKWVISFMNAPKPNAKILPHSVFTIITLWKLSSVWQHDGCFSAMYTTTFVVCTCTTAHKNGNPPLVLPFNLEQQRPTTLVQKCKARAREECKTAPYFGAHYH